MRPLNFNAEAQAARERAAKANTYRGLVVKQSRLARFMQWLVTPLW